MGLLGFYRVSKPSTKTVDDLEEIVGDCQSLNHPNLIELFNMMHCIEVKPKEKEIVVSLFSRVCTRMRK